MELFWHRRDLRIADNVGLAAAADRDTVAPLFVFDEAILDHASDVRVRRLIDSLHALRSAYQDRGSELIVAHGDPAAVVPAVAMALDVERVVWNRDYSGLARQRDAGVRRALHDAGIRREAHHDSVLQTPDSIRTNAGDPYAVYTYYWRKWTEREAADPKPAPDAASLADPASLSAGMTSVAGHTDGGQESAIAAVTVGELPTPSALGFDEPAAAIGPAGTEPARNRLSAFLDDAVFSYDDDRDYPSRNGTARLSTFMKYGEIGVREVYAATEEALATARAMEPTATDDDEQTAADHVEAFQQQLAWREFYTQVLYHNPSVVTENYKTYEEGIDWRDDSEEIEAWKRGETGYPIVDAGMRQLRDEAFMHNRVRMIVASFLTKDLLADWRHGYAHFKSQLADHDTANDNGGWQWAASTGTDAQPYFRIFNPMTQGERYDPDATYIKSYVPELRGVDADLIHEWHELSPTQRSNAAPAYPSPIVDHSERREDALAMYKRARGEDPTA